MSQVRFHFRVPQRAVLFLWAVAFAVLPLRAQVRYVLETAAGTDVPALRTRYGFDIASVSRSSTEDLFVIRSAYPLTDTALAALRAEAGVREVELSRDFTSSVRESVRPPQTALEPLGSAFSSRTSAPFYGNIVLSAYANQRSTEIIRLSDALRTFGPARGTVAIIDTGVDTTHPALQGVLLPGYDFTLDRSDTVAETMGTPPLTQSTVEILDSRFFALRLDQSTVEILDQSTVEILDGTRPKAFGHGTMVAGLVHLVAPNARILPLKAFRADGSASLYDIARAIRYAADAGANVINLSLSYTTDSPVLRSAVVYAQKKGATCVASAGNLGRDMRVYPAAYPYVVGVGSANFSDRRSPFSNYGGSVLTSAPGEALITLYPGGNYAAVWGTSFSAALISGAVAQVQAVSPQMRGGALKDALNHGVRISQDMGDARLDLIQLLTYTLHP
ncbi:MAG: S8 family serine peptidase [Bryobacteraceae bacterium]